MRVGQLGGVDAVPCVVRLRVLAKGVCGRAGRRKIEVVFVQAIRSRFVYYLNETK